MRIPRKYIEPTFVLIKYRKNTVEKEEDSALPNEE